MYKIAITNRKLCPDLLEQIKRLENSDFQHIILREKDLSSEEYTDLAKKAIKISKKIILHSFIEVCDSIDYKNIHLPFHIFCENAEKLKSYNVVGVSIHSLEEAKTAEKLGATYVTASHIFPTKCKEGLLPRGLSFLEEICKNINIPVYALGGINEENSQSCIDKGACGVCMMSQAMKY